MKLISENKYEENLLWNLEIALECIGRTERELLANVIDHCLELAESSIGYTVPLSRVLETGKAVEGFQ